MTVAIPAEQHGEVDAAVALLQVVRSDILKRLDRAPSACRIRREQQ